MILPTTDDARALPGRALPGRAEYWLPRARGLHSFTFQLNLSRV